MRNINNTFYYDRLDWKSLGYSTLPTSVEDTEFRNDREFALWCRLQEVLEQAKLGDFSHVNELLELHHQASDAVYQSRCIRVLGDVGTRACFTKAIEELDRGTCLGPWDVVNYCNSLYTWGALSTVPVILNQYERAGVSSTTEMLPLYLSLILENDEWGPLSEEPEKTGMANYRHLVMTRYTELKNRFGGDDVLIVNAEPYGVVSFAKLILRFVSGNFDHSLAAHLRRRFEASTGINSSDFFKGRKFQPLVAAAIVEEFLESPQAQKYEEGVRYFFGHRIPDESPRHHSRR